MSLPALKKRKINDTSLPQSQERTTSPINTGMATTYSSDSGYRSLSQSPSDSTTSLIHLPPAQRQQAYKEIFIKRVERLSHISEPDECAKYPELHNEILDNYLRFTTFTVDVWTNYDAAAQKFYIDKRLEDCGKLNLKPSEIRHLEGKDPNRDIEIYRIIFEIRTSFTRLADVRILAKPSKRDGVTDITLKVARTNSDHPVALEFINDICAEFNENGVTAADDQRGLVIADLENLAGMFRRAPTDAEMYRMSRNINQGPWMDFNDRKQDNPGWTDIEVYGKGCPYGCEGCDGNSYSKFHYSRGSSYWW